MHDQYAALVYFCDKVGIKIETCNHLDRMHLSDKVKKYYQTFLGLVTCKLIDKL